MTPHVHVGPEPDPEIEAAVSAAGGRLAALDAADAVVWADSMPGQFPASLPEGVRWVQIPPAGVEAWRDVVDRDRAWTSSTGAYGPQVAEHTLALMLAGGHRLAESARARTWTEPEVVPLAGSTVAIVGAGGIGRDLIGLLAPFDVEVLAVTRRGLAVEGAARTLPADRVDEVWPDAHYVVLAAPATEATRHLVDAAQLAAMRSDAWLVNIARGSLIDTDALVAALAAGEIGGAALDVTDPEPLPDGHPLWSEPRALITPHVANPLVVRRPAFLARVRENVERFAAGEPLAGVIDVDAGY